MSDQIETAIYASPHIRQHLLKIRYKRNTQKNEHIQKFLTDHYKMVSAQSSDCSIVVGNVNINTFRRFTLYKMRFLHALYRQFIIHIALQLLLFSICTT